ncbi:putative g-protein coupled receptor protein [Botrytis fragariae]|uniref:Putative g-protein coupled receptor protein n=1 Tax=Botrytis fragariae TaxID=1964551 RepID=A0A8H6AI96_9HELO|nr:putative g-protein coupled receptor protein [Botrytis fragariae]KAF5867829.1 putative g-protein coupled receptor protein [Botrytis fragariae]
MGQLSQREVDILIIIERTTASISVLGTLALFATFIFFKSFRTLSNTIIFYASFANLFANVAALIGGSALSQVNSPLCQFQGFLLEMFMQSDPWWSLAMATNVYLVFFYRFDAAQLKKLYPYYALICYGLPFIPAMVCLFVKNNEKGKIYGNATLWCWIDGPWAPLRIYSYYAPIWITILAALCIYVRVGIEIFRARNQLNGVSHRTDPSLHTDAGGKSPLPPQGSITNASEATNKDYESEHEQPIFTGTRTTEIEVTHGSWENGTALNTNTTPRYPRASDVNHLRTPAKDPESNYRVTISAVPNTTTSSGRGGARRNASSLDKIKWAYTKVAMLFCISILITWVPASVNRVYGLRFPDKPSFVLNIGSAIVLPLQGFWNTVIYFTTSLGICRSVWADLRGPSKQHRKTEGFRMMDRPMTGIHRGGTKETESMVELSTSRSQTNRSLRSAEVESI